MVAAVISFARVFVCVCVCAWRACVCVRVRVYLIFMMHYFCPFHILPRRRRTLAARRFRLLRLRCLLLGRVGFVALLISISRLG